MNARRQFARPSRQRGVAAIEFALVFMLGILPMLLITINGVMIFAAQQSLTLASAEGARAALQYGTPAQRQANACNAAQNAMAWLLTFSGETASCATPPTPGGAYTPVAVSAAAACPSNANVQCITVVTSFDYNNHPFIPGVTALYGWVLSSSLSSSATVQMNPAGS
ncbi:TadE/TadG family type IV pilus assembly protein [Dyella terrae]|uniref:TadE/TadG family type IV pilus assembly protein n=1 Tax=Dyella terrae TaxID=522259 RepID=UPI001EFD1478|nr:TadE/TadG family type IV pilus assembly protein [Dyella terrae]ULU26386.1 pilus assembly protein [Dyella terrae]